MDDEIRLPLNKATHKVFLANYAHHEIYASLIKFNYSLTTLLEVIDLAEDKEFIEVEQLKKTFQNFLKDNVNKTPLAIIWLALNLFLLDTVKESMMVSDKRVDALVQEVENSYYQKANRNIWQPEYA